MKVLVTGADGQLGFAVVKELKKQIIDVIPVSRKDVDLNDGPRTALLIEKAAPDVVVHCAAYTNVEKAQEDYITCNAINAGSAKSIAITCNNIGAKLVYISTDYVFKGDGDQPFEIDSPKGPLNEYGLSKLAGEENVKNECKRYFIIRTSWLFAKESKNFVNTIRRLCKDKKEISVVCDQIGSPTYADDLAVLICDMIKTEKYGIYHATNENYCSFYEFACEIVKKAGSDCEVKPVKTTDYPAKAKRPLNSRLSKKSLDEAGFSRLPTWQNALDRYFETGK